MFSSITYGHVLLIEGDAKNGKGKGFELDNFLEKLWRLEECYNIFIINE
jgi:hypothetical protein